MDYTDRLILETNYRQEAAAAQKEVERLVVLQRELDEALRTGSTAQAAYDTITARLTADLAQQAGVIEQARDGLAALTAQDRAAADAARDAARAARELAAAQEEIGQAAARAAADLHALEAAEAAAANQAVSAAVEQSQAELHALDVTERAAAAKAAQVRATLDAAGGGKNPLVDGLLGQARAAQEVGELQAALQREVEALREVERAMQRGAATAEDYARAEAAARAAAVQLGAVQQQFVATGSKAGAAARAVLDFSRGFEDFTVAGPLGVLNNVPGMFGNIGTAVGLTTTQVAAATAGVSLLATGAFILYRNWDRVVAAFGAGDEKATLFGQTLTELKKTIEDIEKKDHKIAIDYDQLATAKRIVEEITTALEAAEALKHAKTSTEEKIAGGVHEAIVEGGGEPAVEKGVAEARKREGTYYSGKLVAPLNQKLADAQTELDRLLNDGGKHTIKEEAAARKAVADLQAEREDAAAKQNALLTGNAAKGDERARAELERLLMAHPDDFRAAGVDFAKFGSGIIGSSKENVEARAEEARSIAKQKKDAAAEKARQDRLTDDLNAQGKEGEDLARAQAAAAALETKRPDIFETEPERIRRTAGERVQRKAQADAQKAQADADREQLRDRQEQDRERVRAELEKSLADPALKAQALDQLFGAEAAPAEDRPRARDAAQERIQRGTNAHLLEQGVEPGQAALLAEQAPEFFRQQAEAQVRQEQAQAAAHGAALSAGQAFLQVAQRNAAELARLQAEWLRVRQAAAAQAPAPAVPIAPPPVPRRRASRRTAPRPPRPAPPPRAPRRRRARGEGPAGSTVVRPQPGLDGPEPEPAVRPVAPVPAPAPAGAPVPAPEPIPVPAPAPVPVAPAPRPAPEAGAEIDLGPEPAPAPLPPLPEAAPGPVPVLFAAPEAAEPPGLPPEVADVARVADERTAAARAAALERARAGEAARAARNARARAAAAATPAPPPPAVAELGKTQALGVGVTREAVAALAGLAAETARHRAELDQLKRIVGGVRMASNSRLATLPPR